MSFLSNSFLVFYTFFHVFPPQRQVPRLDFISDGYLSSGLLTLVHAVLCGIFRTLGSWCHV